MSKTTEKRPTDDLLEAAHEYAKDLELAAHPLYMGSRQEVERSKRELRAECDALDARIEKAERERNEAVRRLGGWCRVTITTKEQELLRRETDGFLAYLTEPGFSDAELERYRTKVYAIEDPDRDRSSI